MARFITSFLLCLMFTACTGKQSAQQDSQKDPKEAAADHLKARGQQVYMANCTSCHNPNPKLDGAVGPALAGSSLELIKARVASATYPAGYKPKRQTTAMPAFPALAPEADALAAYLSNFK